jgi:hypothetical protein
VEDRATVRALRTTAERALAAHAEANQLEKELRVLVAAMAPALLAQPGIGPITAAQVLISWSHPGRLRSEAAFAMLAGAAPIPASSGRVSATVPVDQPHPAGAVAQQVVAAQVAVAQHLLPGLRAGGIAERRLGWRSRLLRGCSRFSARTGRCSRRSWRRS